METCSWLVSLVSWLVNQAVTCFGRSGEEFSLSDSPPQFASLVHITAPCWATDPSTLPGVRHDATRARHYTLTTLMNNFNPSGIIIQRERQQSRRWHWLTIVSWNKVDLISFPTGNSLWRPNEAESGETTRSHFEKKTQSEEYESETESSCFTSKEELSPDKAKRVEIHSNNSSYTHRLVIIQSCIRNTTVIHYKSTPTSYRRISLETHEKGFATGQTVVQV